MIPFGHVVLVFLAVCTVFTELKHGKIYNWLTIPAILTGLLLASFRGLGELQGAFAGMVIGGGIFLIPYLMSGLATGRPVIGGGDVKFTAAVGSLTGVHFTLWVIYYGILIGAAIGFGTLAWKWAARRWGKREPGERGESLWLMKLPFGTALATAVIIVLIQSNQAVSQ